ncbi:hypothetical protein BJ878DRAFT_563918 [Calycina marina]|uniref:DUF8213 domain-containing protein n=1 Tax=Calycina marina TaxID=1763456 RepID=A0A9P7ZBC9_9HELO|nr:hypothetical protein BJ878DRAFT_563918 [Calycina marina]
MKKSWKYCPAVLLYPVKMFLLSIAAMLAMAPSAMATVTCLKVEATATAAWVSAANKICIWTDVVGSLFGITVIGSDYSCKASAEPVAQVLRSGMSTRKTASRTIYARISTVLLTALRKFPGRLLPGVEGDMGANSNNVKNPNYGALVLLRWMIGSTDSKMDARGRPE